MSSNLMLSFFPPGSVPWSPRDRAQMLKQGYCDGWEVSFRQPVSRYPELANDLDNAHFVQKKKTGKRGLG